jgi:predicted transcriptional regulator of viral defense system
MKALGGIEAQFFAYIQMMEIRTVKTGDIQTALGLSSEQERQLLSRLSRAGMITRVLRGVYLVPEELPFGGKWTPDETLALNTLIRDRGGRYQICGLNAFNFYGYDEQVPTRVYAYNDIVSGEKTIGAITLNLIKVDRRRLGDTVKIKTREGIAVYPSRARTLVDAIYDWARFNTLPRAYKWIRDDLRAGRVTAQALVKCALRFGDVGTIRRLGTLLESEHVDEALLKELEKALGSSSAHIPWNPRRPKRGITNKRWGVILNEEQ